MIENLQEDQKGTYIVHQDLGNRVYKLKKHIGFIINNPWNAHHWKILFPWLLNEHATTLLWD